MRYCTFMIAAIFLIGTGCSKESKTSITESKPPLTDAVTLELKFPDTDVTGDFMLARPFMDCIAVDHNNDVLVVDEAFVKVFDSSGKGKALLGGKGEGPGEFDRPFSIWISPNGYFTVFGGRAGFTAHYFRPDRSFIERVDYMLEQPFKEVLESRNLRSQRPEIVFNLGESERLYSLDSSDIDRENRTRREVFLFHQTTDSLRVIADYAQTSYVSGPAMSGGYILSFLGTLLVALLPDNRVVYTHTFHDSKLPPEQTTYTLAILDLDTMEENYLIHGYTPNEIEWESPTYSEDYKTRYPDQWRRQQELNKVTEDYLTERKYMTPLMSIITDRNYIFAFAYPTKENMETGQVPVDVFDGEKLEYLCTAYFPLPYSMAVKNGYAYRVNDYMQTGESPQIEKYRIDARVYKPVRN